MDTMWSLLTQISTLVTLLLALIPEYVVSVCDPPNSTHITDLDNLRQVSTSKTSYDTNEVVAFACGDGYGHGYLSMKCLGASTWGDRSRQCEDMQTYGGGAIFGTLCGGFTLIICIVFIAFSTRLKKQKEKEEAVEMKIMETADATKA